MLLAVCLWAACLTLPHPAQAQALALHFPGVTGGSTAPSHTNDIALLSCSWGASRSTRSIVYSSLDFTKLIDNSSPTLALDAAAGVSTPLATVDSYAANGSHLFTLYLTNAVISAVSGSGSAGGFPAENVSLRYSGLLLATYGP